MKKGSLVVVVLILVLIAVGLYFVLLREGGVVESEIDNDVNIDLEGCALYFDGCNTCHVLNGVIGSCTKKDCQEYEEPECLEFTDESPSANCKVWFDGCNNCDVVDGVIESCTYKFCDEYESPVCLEFSE